MVAFNETFAPFAVDLAEVKSAGFTDDLSVGLQGCFDFLNLQASAAFPNAVVPVEQTAFRGLHFVFVGLWYFGKQVLGLTGLDRDRDLVEISRSICPGSVDIAVETTATGRFTGVPGIKVGQVEKF